MVIWREAAMLEKGEREGGYGGAGVRWGLGVVHLWFECTLKGITFFRYFTPGESAFPFSFSLFHDMLLHLMLFGILQSTSVRLKGKLHLPLKIFVHTETVS